MANCMICGERVRLEGDAAEVVRAEDVERIAKKEKTYLELTREKRTGLAHAECFGDQQTWVLS